MAWQETVPSDRIDPHVRPPKEPADFPNAQAAFDAGNYPVALDMARDTDPEVYAAALIMGGAIDAGLALLEELTDLSETANKVRDYARWCLNLGSDIPAAFSDDPDRPIDVLVIAMPGSAKALPFKEATGFNVIVIELTADQFGTTLKDILAELPHKVDPKIALVIDCFGPYVPEGLFEAGFPVAAWVADHDYFLPLRHRDLSRAQLLVCNSASEHSELAACYAGRVAALPGHDTYSQFDQAAASGEPDWDILFTGRAFVPYMRDKAQQLFRLATIEEEDARISIVEGYVPEDEFAGRLRTAANVPLFWRYGGGLQTRAADVLRQGRGVLSPESGMCRDYLGDAAEGYRVIGVGTPERFDAAGLDHADVSLAAGSLFWPSPAREERLLKFCLFQCLFIPEDRPQQAAPTHLPVEQRGYPVDTGIPVYTSIMTANMRSPDTAAHFNAAGCAGFYGAILSQENQKLGQLSLEFFREGRARFPGNAALRFNLARALQVFGLHEEALAAFEVLAETCLSLDYSPSTDSVLSHRVRVLADMFNYGDFYRLAVDALTDQDMSAEALKLVGSSAASYLAAARLEAGDLTQALAHLDRAVELDPLHATPHKLRMECLDRVGGNDAEMVRSFYQAVNLYPPVLLSHAEYGVRGELALDRPIQAEEILKKLVLLYARTSDPEGTPLEISDNCKRMIREHRHLLTGWIGDLVDQMISKGAL